LGNNAAFSDQPERKTLHQFRKIFAFTGIAAVSLPGAGCSAEPEPAPPSSFLPAAPATARGCDDGGFLQTSIYGAFEADIRWGSDELDCEGMPRPDSEGARLRFAGALNDGAQELAFIIAMPDLVPGASARELATNVTLIAEGSGRFFSTPGLDSCWTDVEMPASSDETPHRFAIDGTLYCIAPIPEVNGTSSVSLEETRFSGWLDWSTQ
jgi:hypothetical protein